MIEEVFGTPQERLMEPPVDDLMGRFKDMHIPVGKTPMAALWSTNETEYLQPQTQFEHNELLNTYYPQRAELPNWKELGYQEEQKSPHFDNKDDKLRKNLNVKSSVVEDIIYNPNENLVSVKMGNKYYTYAGTPDQVKRFVQAGSIGEEINRINNNKGTSLQRTASRSVPLNSIFGGK